MRSTRFSHIRHLLLAAALLPLLAAAAAGQGRYDDWHFGYGRSIRFTPSGAVADNASSISTPEGSASICDPNTGKLLFYSDGVTVWNRDGAPMPNGTGLAGHHSASQAALIVPAPGKPSLYYIFTTDAIEAIDPPNGYAYSVVDMTLDGGRGDVTAKNVFILGDVSEKQTAVAHCGGNDYVWVITHGLDGNAFYAFLVTPTGVSTTPVISKVGSPIGGRRVEEYRSAEGCMKASPDGTMLAMACMDGTTELYRFDVSTGRVFDPIHLTSPDPTYPAYGVSFSPDNSRLYFATYGRLDQYTVSIYDRTQIPFTRRKISDWPGSSLQLGPDRKIYGGPLVGGWMPVIATPNAIGAACNATQNGLLVGGDGAWGLPNNIDAWATDGGCGVRASLAFPSGPICQGSWLDFDATLSNGTSFEWYFTNGIPENSTESRPHIRFPLQGIHQVRLIVHRGPIADTAWGSVEVSPGPTVDAGPDRTLCVGECARLEPLTDGGIGPYTYRWAAAPGLSCGDCDTPEVCPTTTTTYRVTITDARGCTATDSVTIGVRSRPSISVRVDRGLNSAPGKRLVVPVLLDGGPEAIGVHRLTLRLGYDPSLLRPMELTPKVLASMTSRTLLEGWNLSVERNIPGEIRISAIPPVATGTIAGSGPLLKLPFTTYITLTKPSDADIVSEIPLTLDMEADQCVAVAPTPGRVRFDLCGLVFRFMEMGLGKNALEPNSPNPFNPSTVINFSLALDGPTRVEIMDAGGRRVDMLVDDYLPAGMHWITWDATEFSSGIYYCRVSSGDWSESRMMMLVK